MPRIGLGVATRFALTLGALLLASISFSPAGEKAPVEEWLTNRSAITLVRIDSIAPHLHYRGGTPPSVVDECSARNDCDFTIAVRDPSTIDRILQELEAQRWVQARRAQAWLAHPRVRIAIERAEGETSVLYVERDGRVWWGDRMFKARGERHWLAAILRIASGAMVSQP